MSYISYLTNHYKEMIESLKQRRLSSNEILLAKRYLKLIDDLSDEGYTEAELAIQSRFNGITRLKQILKTHDSLPFPKIVAEKTENDFSDREYELNEYLNTLIENKGRNQAYMTNALSYALDYAAYIEKLYEPSTAFVFLLRDTLVPYIHFVKRFGTSNAFPLLIGRRFFKLINRQSFDDRIRGVIIDALEAEIKTYDSFTCYCKSKIDMLLRSDTELKTILSSMLPKNFDKILVVESGIHGTFPIMLSALDDRVDFVMYTAAPFLQPVLKDRCFTDCYENIRGIEALTCQARLFELNSFENGSFFIKKSVKNDIIELAENEISIACDNARLLSLSVINQAKHR